MKGKRYSEEFKAEAVRQVTERGYSVADVARLLGVTEGALRYHIKKGNIKKKWKL